MKSFILSAGAEPLGEFIVDETKFFGRGGSHYPLLYCQPEIKYYQLRNPLQDFFFRDAQAELHLEGIGKIAETLPVPLGTWQRGHWEHSGRDLPGFDFALDARRISALERVRNGGDMKLQLWVRVFAERHGIIQGNEKSRRPNVWGMDAVQRFSKQLDITIPRSNWIEQVLSRVGWGVVHLIELPAVPVESCKKLQHAFTALSQARQRHLEGHYDDAVGKCRVALDKFFDRVEVTNEKGVTREVPILKKVWQVKLGQSTYDWLNGALGAIKSASNKSHHSPNPHYDQFESQMVIAITTTLVAYVARTAEQEEEV